MSERAATRAPDPPPQSPLPSTERLLRLVEALSGQRLLVVADLVADRFLYGVPRRISREAPVLILEHESERTVLGGGANAAANARSLGGRPTVLGRVGADPAGERVIEQLEELGVDAAGVLRSSRFVTPTKTRILGGAPHTLKQQIVRYDQGSPAPLEDDEVDAVARLASAALEEMRSASGTPVAVLSDYGYGAATPVLVPTLRDALGDSGLLLVDSRYQLDRFEGLDGATPNQEEAETLLGGSLEGKEDLLRGGARLLTLLGAGFVLITRGSEGMALVERDPSGLRVSTLPASGGSAVTDVTGAGDTVIATFGLALAAGGSPLESAALANYAGGIVVMKPGTATASPDELARAVESDDEPLRRLRTEQVPLPETAGGGG